MSSRSVLVFDERGSNGTAAAQPPLAQATNRTSVVAGADAKYLVYPLDEYGNELEGGELLQVHTQPAHVLLPSSNMKPTCLV